MLEKAAQKSVTPLSYRVRGALGKRVQRGAKVLIISIFLFGKAIAKTKIK